ncbi:oxygenase MpaB family protein [Telluribacter sp. SYSU D00476]|uniref:oxygenase MpaB family protein n=1 Tax=Telluribacter sp. SYSU D00476 TaxID=2811430 RepID=UPI001FF55046|nr:oxygenase MpaB family protein [Telluribacter sp. SYSU D00476]
MPKVIKSSRSFPDSLLNPLRQTGDVEADAVISQVAEQGGHPVVGSLMKYLTDYENLSLEGQPIAVREFITQQSTLSNGTDLQTFNKGIHFFWQHYRLISLLLGTYSLPYCYAGANGAQVLWISERIKSMTYQRLEETGAFVFGIMQEKDWTNGRNFIRIAKVRLLHAAVRWYTLRSERWNLDWGYPICQEDMAGTNLAFSYIIIRGLRQLNQSTTDAGEEAYLYFWNVVGQLLGVKEEILPHNLREAYHLGQAIARRQFRPSEAGKGLTRALLQVMEQQTPQPSLRNLPAAQMRYFLGDELANLLDVPQVEWEDRFLRLFYQVPLFPQLLTLQQPDSPVMEKYWR